ncbi:MAG: DMT family transporter [bacterium]|nr:DMT family transporter [bacterium]MDE0241824.1 DMT family transporter [bacterium]MDE0417283.1 DMT family transporter [bacterium]
MNDQPGLAIASVIAGVCLLTVCDVFAKTVTQDIDPFSFILLRSCVAFLPVFVALSVSRTWRYLRTRRPWGQACRGMAMALAYTFFLRAIMELPIADATAVTYSSPFIVAILSRIFLGERVSLSRWAAISVGFAGALVIIQPGSDAFRPAALWGIGAAISVAVTVLLARRLGATEPAPVTAFYTTVAFALTGLVPVLVVPGTWQMAGGINLWFIVLAGLLAGSAHFLIIFAYRKGEASFVVPFEYSSLLVAVALGYLVFGDVPTVMVAIGMMLIALAGIILARRGSGP